MNNEELTTIARALITNVITDNNIGAFYDAILTGSEDERYMVMGVLSKYMDTLEDVVLRLCDALDG